MSQGVDGHRVSPSSLTLAPGGSVSTWRVAVAFAFAGKVTAGGAATADGAAGAAATGGGRSSRATPRSAATTAKRAATPRIRPTPLAVGGRVATRGARTDGRVTFARKVSARTDSGGVGADRRC